MNNNENVKKNNRMVTVILLILLLAAIGYIVYDKCIKMEKPSEMEPTNVIERVKSDKITSLKRVAITDKEEEINIDGNKYKIKREISVDGAFLLIDDALKETENGSTIYADYAYVTNKYAIFTVIAQDWETIVYIIDKDGKQITFEDNDYQVHDFKIIDGNLETSGHIFCGLDGDCPDKELIINYVDNSITVTTKN